MRPAAPAPASGSSADASTHHIRGSSLLLAGRVLSLTLNFATQILIVRSLTKSDYGAFAYALSLATMVSAATTFGLDRAIARFIPIYDERGDRERTAGTLLVVFASVSLLGLAAVVAAVGLQSAIGRSFGGDAGAVRVILIVLLLGPLEAIDGLVVGSFAVFARPRAIFLRRYVLAPGLRLAVVGLLIARDGSVLFLATGYVIAGAIGLALYGVVLLRILRARGLLVGIRRARAAAPVGTIFAFAVPLLTTDLLFIVMRITDTTILGHHGGASEIASYRAVFPVARLNEMVLLSFALLFAPMAARLFARGDLTGLGRVYRQTTAWLVALSFPVFVTTTVFADQVTTFLFGSRYADSGPYLLLLSAAFFASVIAGFNGVTLRAMGKVRWVVTVDAIVIPLNLALGLLLIPRWGAGGAAVATLVTLAVHNIGKQVSLQRSAGIGLLDAATGRVFVVVSSLTALLFAVERATEPPLAFALALVAAASIVVLRTCRASLRLPETFPELARLPLLRAITGARRH